MSSPSFNILSTRGHDGGRVTSPDDLEQERLSLYGRRSAQTVAMAPSEQSNARSRHQDSSVLWGGGLDEWQQSHNPTEDVRPWWSWGQPELRWLPRQPPPPPGSSLQCPSAERGDNRGRSHSCNHAFNLTFPWQRWIDYSVEVEPLILRPQTPHILFLAAVGFHTCVSTINAVVSCVREFSSD